MIHKPIDIFTAFTEAPQPIDYVLPSMVAGTVGAIVSPGGTGKSMLALQLAVQVAGGPDLLSMGTLPTGQVVYLPIEDPPFALRHRLYALRAYLDDKQKQVVAKNLTIQPLGGKRLNIMAPEWFSDLKKIAQGRRLMILDTLRRFHVEDENDSGAVTRVISQIESIASETGCSIVFLHHTSKSAVLAGAEHQQQASRGSSVLADNIRWQSYLADMSRNEAKVWNIDECRRKSYVRFGVSKASYGDPFQGRWLRRLQGGVLIDAELDDMKSSQNTGGLQRAKV